MTLDPSTDALMLAALLPGCAVCVCTMPGRPVDLDVHPRVIMGVLRHADAAVTMEVYTNASAKSTSDALRRLGESLK